MLVLLRRRNERLILQTPEGNLDITVRAIDHVADLVRLDVRSPKESASPGTRRQAKKVTSRFPASALRIKVLRIAYGRTHIGIAAPEGWLILRARLLKAGGWLMYTMKPRTSTLTVTIPATVSSRSYWSTAS